MTNVLADRHHAGLYRSLQLLARRLGWNLYTPHGREWWESETWNFGRKAYGDDRLARQFLEPAATPFGTRGLYISEDEEFPGQSVMGVTLAGAREMQWDIVIASLDDNQAGFAQFARERGARYVVQCGNTGQYIDWSLDPIVLNSSEMPLLGRGMTYHQELDPAFVATRRVIIGHHESKPGMISPTYGPRPLNPYTVRSFVHLMNETHAALLWRMLRNDLPDHHFERYGHAPAEPDPTYVTNAKPIGKIAKLMALSGWGFHDKPVGDGFGHVVHGWAAVGRPLIGHASHYAGKLAAPLWRDGETCIDLGLRSIDEAAYMVLEISGQPERYRDMCAAIAAEFDRIDYAAEAEQIRALLA